IDGPKRTGKWDYDLGGPSSREIYSAVTVMRAGVQAESSAEEPKKIRVLIADDHVTVLEGLAAMIGRQPDMVVVAEAADGQEALDFRKLDVLSRTEDITVASRPGLIQL